MNDPIWSMIMIMIQIISLMLMITELCVIGGRYAAVKQTSIGRVALEGLIIAIATIVLLYGKIANL